MSARESLLHARPERVVTVFGREYRPDRWPYNEFHFGSDEEHIEQLISAGLATARLLYMRGIYSAEEMEEHMDEAVKYPFAGELCPHRILPDNCRNCTARDPEWWMGP